MQKRFFLTCSLIIVAILSQPIYSFAQSGGTSFQRYTPRISQTSTFGGVSFSGVGSMALGCTGLDSKISGFMSGIINGNSSTGGLTVGRGGPIDPIKPASVSNIAGSMVGATTSVPVADSKTQASSQQAAENTKKLQTKESCLDKAAYALAEQSLYGLTNKTLNWVNSGFGGNPLYVRDVDSYLKSVKDEHLKSYLTNAAGSNPVFGNSIRSIFTQQSTGKSDGLAGVVMNTPQGQKYQAFQDDFTSGGWSMFLDPSYNPIETMFEEADKLSFNFTRLEQNIREELLQGEGFLSMKNCAQWANDGQAQTALSADPQCLRWETVTPGAIIARQVSQVTNAPIERLTQADEINEVLGGVLDSLLNRLFAGGLGSLRDGSVEFSGGGLGLNSVLGQDGSPLATITGTGLGYVGASGIDTNFDITRPHHLRALSQAQANYINRMRDSQISMLRLVPRVGVLDYCLPGPNPTWQVGLNENYGQFIAHIQELKAAIEQENQAPGFFSNLPVFGGIYSGLTQLVVGDNINAINTTGITVYDRLTGNEETLSGRFYDLSGPNDNKKPDAFMNYVAQSANSLMTAVNDTYDYENITNAYLSVASSPSDSLYTRGFINRAYREAGNLMSYVSDISAADREYDEESVIAQTALEELELIRQEVNGIVSVAKARYVSQQSAAGTPVNMQCINNAYKIDPSPIVPVARLESETPHPIIDQSNAASEYFYSNL